MLALFPRGPLMDPWQADFTASWVTSTSTTFLTFPLDTLKVFWQANNSNPRQTLSTLGVLGLYRGVQVSLLLNGVIVSLIFTLFEGWKRELARLTPLTGLQIPIAAGFLSGLFGSLVLCPTNCTKARLQIHGGSLKEAIKLLRFRGMYRGIPAEMTACSIGRACYFGSYEGVKSLFVTNPTERRWWHSMAAATVTGVTGWTVIFSVDLVKTKLQATPYRYKGYWDCAAQTYRSKGVLGFWTGYHLAVSRSTLNAIIALPLFDGTKEYLHGNYVR